MFRRGKIYLIVHKFARYTFVLCQHTHTTILHTLSFVWVALSLYLHFSFLFLCRVRVCAASKCPWSNQSSCSQTRIIRLALADRVCTFSIRCVCTVTPFTHQLQQPHTARHSHHRTIHPRPRSRQCFKFERQPSNYYNWLLHPRRDISIQPD